jgi:hypothetical protein
MGKKPRRKAADRMVTPVSIRWLRRLANGIQFESTDTPAGRAYRLAVPLIVRFMGLDWYDTYLSRNGTGPNYLRPTIWTDEGLDTHMMRATIFAEMLFNLQEVPGFDACLEQMSAGKIESAFAELEIGRLMAIHNLDFSFVRPTGTRGESYDLEIRYPDGYPVCAETKCKLEETEITLQTVADTLNDARPQLPQNKPGIVFLKIPRHWIDDVTYASSLEEVVAKFLRGTGRVVSVKVYTSKIVYSPDELGEVLAYREFSSSNHRFPTERNRNWDLLPRSPAAPESWNGLPPNWLRLFHFDGGREWQRRKQATNIRKRR